MNKTLKYLMTAIAGIGFITFFYAQAATNNSGVDPVYKNPKVPDNAVGNFSFLKKRNRGQVS